MTRLRRGSCLALVPAVFGLTLAGCWSSSDREVVVYTALDSEFSEPIFADFTAATEHRRGRPKFDTEATKTVEPRPRRSSRSANRPALRRVLEQRDSAHAASRSGGASWTSTLRRPPRRFPRCIARAEQNVARVRRPGAGAGGQHRPGARGGAAGVDPRFPRREMAIEGAGSPSRFSAPRPRTRHAFSSTGATDRRPRSSFAQDEGQRRPDPLGQQAGGPVGGAAGRLAFGLTDTDDAIIETRERPLPVAIVYPDQGEDGNWARFSFRTRFRS